MNSLEINKGFAAVLVAGMSFLGAGLIADALVHPARLEHSAIKVQGVAAEAASAPAAVEQPDPPVAALLASADPAKGETDVKRLCSSCHTFVQGGKAGVGPNLYGVVGDKHGHMEGFSYSSALLAKSGPWTFDELYAWLKSPRTYAPGTKMSFAGLASAPERADIIAYLNKNSDHPEKLPAAPAVAPAAAKTAAPVANSNVAAGQPGATGARPSATGQMSQPSANQNMPAAAAAQSQQPPNATNNAGPGTAGGQPQPSPDAHSR